MWVGVFSLYSVGEVFSIWWMLAACCLWVGIFSGLFVMLCSVAFADIERNSAFFAVLEIWAEIHLWRLNFWFRWIWLDVDEIISSLWLQKFGQRFAHFVAFYVLGDSCWLMQKFYLSVAFGNLGRGLFCLSSFPFLVITAGRGWNSVFLSQTEIWAAVCSFHRFFWFRWLLLVMIEKYILSASLKNRAEIRSYRWLFASWC